MNIEEKVRKINELWAEIAPVVESYTRIRTEKLLPCRATDFLARCYGEEVMWVPFAVCRPITSAERAATTALAKGLCRVVRRAYREQDEWIRYQLLKRKFEPQEPK